VIRYQTAAPVDADRARSLAKTILRERRFHPSRMPQPFRAPLQRAGDAVASFVNRLVGRLPGPPLVAWLLLGALVVLLVIAVALPLARRRASRPMVSSRGSRTAGGESAHTLERAAERAEQAGDLDAAVRLRFRAGLLRLDAAGVIDYEPSLTTAQVAHHVRSASFEEIASSFEEIAYGGRVAAAQDVRLSRDAWRDVLEDCTA